MSVELLDSQLPKHWTLCQQMGGSVILRLTEWAEGLYRAVELAGEDAVKKIAQRAKRKMNPRPRAPVSLAGLVLDVCYP